MKDLCRKELLETKSRAFAFTVVGLMAAAIGVVAGVEVADYYLK